MIEDQQATAGTKNKKKRSVFQWINTTATALTKLLKAMNRSQSTSLKKAVFLSMRSE